MGWLICVCSEEQNLLFTLDEKLRAELEALEEAFCNHSTSTVRSYNCDLDRVQQTGDASSVLLLERKHMLRC